MNYMDRERKGQEKRENERERDQKKKTRLLDFIKMTVFLC